MDLQFQIQQWLEKRNKNVSHRQLVIISGEQSWAIEQAEQFLKGFSKLSPDPTLWVGFRNTATIAEHCGTYRQHLGQERDAVVYNCFSGLRANALIAYSGIVRAHGLMILICPEFEKWPSYDDPQAHKRTSFGFSNQGTQSLFTLWLIKNILNEPTALVVKQNGISGEPAYVAASELTHSLYETSAEQQIAIEQIVHTAAGHRHRPLVVTADRGRGKSSALGMAASRLIKEQQKTIIVTAPTMQNVEQVFAHNKQSVAPRDSSQTNPPISKGSLRYIPPDILLRDDHQADMLFIDEAAAIPASILKELLKRFPRVVMCTTVHGYEGGGRGFELRFKPYLDQVKAGWKHLHLSAPIRWYPNDVLECFWFKVMLMQDEPALPTVCTELCSLNYQEVDRSALPAGSNTLFTMFNLLVNAHYQTTPDDLVRLLDAPEQSLHSIECQGRILAVALLVDEGGETLEAIAEEIACGQRRVLGHMVAQNLAFHTADSLFCTLKQRRILRIAVHPQYRNSGIGTHLLQSIVKDAQQAGIDMLSSSFGATPDLLYFWKTNNFVPLKLGFKRDAASDEVSAIVCRGLNSNTTASLAVLHRRFGEELLFHSTRHYQKLDSDLMCHLFKTVAFDLTVTPQENKLLEQFLAGSRNYQSCERIITKYFILTLSQQKLTKISAENERLLMAVLIQHKTAREVCTLFSFTGKKALQHNILIAMRSLL